MTYDLKNRTSDIVCDSLEPADVNESFARCVEDDVQILGWIRNTEFQPSEELDDRLRAMKEEIRGHYLKALLGINEFGIENVFNRGLGYKIQLINELVEVLRKYERYD